MTERRSLRPSLPSTRAALLTLMRLTLLSLLVGAVLAFLNLNPLALWRGLWRTLSQGAVDLFGTGIDGIAVVLALVATGAVIVLPLWLVGALLRSRRR